jgi:hypothetical protein
MRIQGFAQGLSARIGDSGGGTATERSLFPRTTD